ncbi:MAG TPA: hypothetical protein DCW97_07870 [Acidobacteria bacterium]|nr:hypothetical protein [Acidobacteriota bacterium]
MILFNLIQSNPIKSRTFVRLRVGNEPAAHHDRDHYQLWCKPAFSRLSILNFFPGEEKFSGRQASFLMVK